MKTFDFKFASPDQNNQIHQKIKNHFEITNKCFKLCELLDEYEVITINDITCKILLFEMNYKKKKIFCATCMVTDHNYWFYLLNNKLISKIIIVIYTSQN